MFPSYDQIEMPLLGELIRRGGQAKPSDRDSEGRTVYEALADQFRLSRAEREQEFLDEGKPRLRWENMVRWARRKLKDKGYLETPRHGLWRVTDRGRAAAQQRGEL